jgi:hypothetical protein
MRTIALALLLASSLALAGCSGKSSSDGSAATGSFELAFADNLASGRLELRGAYLHAPNGWVQALGNGTVYDLKGAGGNLTQSGELRAGDYDRLQVNFASFSADGRSALLTQTGIDIAVNITVPEGGTTQVGLVISWVESLYESEKGLAFAPVLTRLTVHVDGVETLRLQANEITSGSGKMPVARMRIFDSTGLEAFVSTFVADNPEKPVIGTAGNITLSATASEAVQKDATLVSYEWEIGSTKLSGNTVSWQSPIDGGNHTVRLTVTDSDGAKDTQAVALALQPGTATRTVWFEGTAQGAGGTNGVVEHLFDVNATGLDGAKANVTHVLLVLRPGAATVPVSDLDVTLDDAAAKRIGAQTGTGSQHKIDVDVKDVASGPWKVRVIPDPAVGAAYNVTVTLTWQGYNPGMAAFLAKYDDGHTHQH